MIRGRRGIAVVATVLLALAFLVTQTYGAEIGMSAAVPLSAVWKERISRNSVFSLDTRSHRNIAELTGQVKGSDTVILPPQTVQALFFEGNRQAGNQIKTTDSFGNIRFTFVYKYGENYRIILVGSPEESPYVITVSQF